LVSSTRTSALALLATVLIASPADDVIRGNARSNHIMALGGNDQVRGYGGDDTIYGGNGDDTVEGDSGHDWITAQVGNDWVAGGPGTDKLIGQDGADWIDGGEGDDGAIQGGPGNDVLIDGDGHDWLVKGDEGDDIVFLGPGADKVFTEEGNDTIHVLPDAFADRIRCDDGTQGAGATDRVIFVGWRDPFDIVDPFGTCEIVLIQQELPPGWPYGAVPPDPALQGVQVTQRTAGRDHLR